MMVNRLIFEGDDDKHVVMNLLYNHRYNGERLDELFSPKAKDGVDTLISTLNEELKATDLGTLGVILDADTNPANQWARVTRVLSAHGCQSIPSTPGSNGTIVATQDGKKIGIWVMPNNQQSGALEDFVGSLIAQGDDLWDKAKKAVNNIPVDKRRFKGSYLSKAQVHTWLAWQEEPGTRMGGAFRRRYLDPNCQQATAFVDWIKRLLV